jgi:superoxide dismutase, Cu-Zn family
MKMTMLTAALALAGAAHADYDVQMNKIDTQGVQAAVGSVHVSAAQGGGVTLTPNLKGLPPGTHGFHVHEFGNCGAKESNGKMEAGTMAGAHYDPAKTGKHEGAEGAGHKGDLPPLVVGSDGSATQAVTAKRLSLSDLDGKSLMIHEGGDNNADQPKPNGGGGNRIACGVIQGGQKKG